MKRIIIGATAFTLVVGGFLGWYAFFKEPEGIPGTLTVTAYLDTEATAKAGCARRLTLVVTVLNNARTQATIETVRLLAGERASVAAGGPVRRIGAGQQVGLRFDLAPLYARLRAQRVDRRITHVQLRDGAGIRYRAAVALDSGARICGR